MKNQFELRIVYTTGIDNREWESEPFKKSLKSLKFFYKYIGDERPDSIFVYKRVYVKKEGVEVLHNTKSYGLYKKTIFGLYRKAY
jgi:hypothetical protein